MNFLIVTKYQVDNKTKMYTACNTCQNVIILDVIMLKTQITGLHFFFIRYNYIELNVINVKANYCFLITFISPLMVAIIHNKEQNRIRKKQTNKRNLSKSQIYRSYVNTTQT